MSTSADATPVGIAVVRNILSPQITGVENPRPSIATFHLTFFVWLKSVGAAVRAIPVKNGPRHCGQCAGSGAEEIEASETNAVPKIASNNKLAATIPRFIESFSFK